ncbi:GAF domain-containing protein [Naasia lichenicola]|nr:GAF domain-containing protein [Naasia lichenicola]
MDTMLRPLMRSWSARAERKLQNVQRPEGPPQVHARGLDPDRILLYGSGPATGWGASHHRLALPGMLARAVAHTTHRGVDIDIRADEDIDAESSVLHLEGRDLAGYDAIVVSIGVRDAVRLTDPALWHASMIELIETLEARTTPSTQIVIASIPSIRSIRAYNSWWGDVAAHRAEAFERITREVAIQSQRTAYLALPTDASSPADEVAPERFRAWASLIAGQVLPSLAPYGRRSASSSLARDHRNQPQPELPRQRALLELGIVGTEPADGLQQIVRAARVAFGTQSAALTLVDHNRQWHHVRDGGEREVIERSRSFCSVTITGAAEMVVPDARVDRRFFRNPDVMGGAICSYAGYPIESPNGYRIGALCVFDTRPRAFSLRERSILRDLAMLAQEEIWSGAPDAVSAG